MVASPLTLLVGVVMVVLLVLALGRRHRKRGQAADDARLRSSLAPTIDLFAVVLGAGGTIADAVTLIAAKGSPAVRPGFTLVLQRQRQGDVLADALSALSSELGRHYHPLAAVLVAGEQGGGPVNQLLERLAVEAERARRDSLDEAVARLPVTLVVPLVVFHLPAVVVGAVVPLVILAMRHLRG